MILNCNSCEKKFVVPDQAITASGRTVQCGSCGNKWKQYPIDVSIKKPVIINNKLKTKIKSGTSKISKPKKKREKIKREIDLYSPEYLAKKHGISLNNLNEDAKKNVKVSFGFYNSLIIIFVFLIALSKGLHFFQDFIIQVFPFTEFYLSYFFESIRNIFELWNNLISGY
jgi:predicted Zn finger-like uncharacterized protein